MSELDPYQSKAVYSNSKSIAVISAAGSGKTRVLTHRIVELIRRGVDPSNILAITFTRDAADVLKQRISKMLGSKCGVTACTIHSLCYQIVKSAREKYGQPGPKVIPESTRWKFLREAVNIKLGPFGFSICPPELLIETIDRMKEKAIPFSAAPLKLAFFISRYEELKRGYSDFGDLLLEANRVLSNDPELLKEWRDRFTHILVDEVQDVSPAQVRVIEKLAQGQSLFIVGDPSQCIYAWRGADPNLFMKLAQMNNAEICELPINYRSTESIVKAAAAVDRGPLAKKLQSVRPGGEPPRIIRAKNLEEEAGIIAQILSEKENPSECAVLMRCNFQAGPIIEALDKAGIPYRVPEELRLENQPEVKQLLKFAEALDPKSKEAQEILRTFLPYVSRTEAVEILMRAENHPAGIYGVVRDPRFSALARSLSGGLTSFLVEAERQFRIVEYWSKVDPESKSTRKENIRVLIDLSRSIKGRGLEGVSELKSKLRGSSKKTGVTISTIHGAKGLEWNHVVVAGCSKGLLPYEAAQTKSDPDEERRCMYVAVTRASNTLTLTCPNMIEKTRPLGASPYVGEISGAFN